MFAAAVEVGKLLSSASENNRLIIRNLSQTAVLRELCAAMERVAVITDAERRPRWTEKRAIIAANLAPGAVVSDGPVGPMSA